MKLGTTRLVRNADRAQFMQTLGIWFTTRQPVRAKSRRPTAHGRQKPGGTSS